MRDDEKFWLRVKTGAPDECWEWQGPKTPDGYGMLYRNGVKIYAHRLAFELKHNQAPTKCVCHSCDNPKCCNPAHLWEGSIADNNRDTVAKGRYVDKNLKLTDRQVQTMRAFYDAGCFNQSELGRIYGISSPHAHAILRRKKRIDT